jgi:hypothetical protein
VVTRKKGLGLLGAHAPDQWLQASASPGTTYRVQTTIEFESEEQALPDGTYELRALSGEWTLALQREGGVLIPLAFSGDLEAFKRAVPEFDAGSN